MDRNAGKAFLIAGLVATAGYVGYHDVGGNDPSTSTMIEQVRAATWESAEQSPLPEKSAIDAQLEATKSRKDSLASANEAVARMAASLDMKSGAYPEGEEGIKLRERDFVAASNAYEAAMKEAGQPVGPDTSFKMDEFEFSLDVLEALGGEVDAARASGSFRP